MFTRIKAQPKQYSQWANANALPVFYLSMILICIFVPGFHWVMPIFQPGAYDSMEVRLWASVPSVIFFFLILLNTSAKRFLLRFQMVQIGSMMAGLMWVSGTAGFGAFYLAASLLGIVGASLTLQTRSQVAGSFVLAILSLGLFFLLHPDPRNIIATIFYSTAFVITVTLALVKVFAHEKEFMLRTALHQAMEDLKLEKAKAFAQAEQAFLGELSSSLAHEINTPLATLQGSLELIGRSLVEEKPNSVYFVPHLNRALTQISRIKEILDNMLFFSGASFDKEVTKDASLLINLALGLLRPYAMKFQVQLEVSPIPAGVQLACTGKDYTQALFQIVKNAIEAASMGMSPKWVKIQTSFHKETKSFEVRVVDSGAGLPLDVREKIFLPFFTLAQRPGHLGLGLSTVKTIVDKYHGRIEYLAAEPHSTFLFVMPTLKDVRVS